MNQLYDYEEQDGRDPGLSDLAYDGAEYELDEFGERIGADELADQGIDEGTTNEDMQPASKVEEGFHEAIKPDNTEHLTDQLEDDQLRAAAEDEYPAESDQDKPTS